jgi:hypothetical protein
MIEIQWWLFLLIMWLVLCVGICAGGAWVGLGMKNERGDIQNEF